MTPRALALLSGLALVGAALLAPAQTPSSLPTGVKVIVNSEAGDKQVAADDLVRIYLGKKTLWDSGVRIHPCMLDENQSLAKAFLETTLKKSTSQYQAYWKRLLFSGGGAPPRTFRSSAQVAEFVAKQPGAIGVVDATLSDDRVKAVTIK